MESCCALRNLQTSSSVFLSQLCRLRDPLTGGAIEVLRFNTGALLAHMEINCTVAIASPQLRRAYSFTVQTLAGLSRLITC